jgi:hypothetical protein
MISSLRSAEGSCGAYIGAVGERQASKPGMPADRPDKLSGDFMNAQNYNNFTMMNPI